MNPRERGFLLLSSHLGDPDRKPLTTAQLRVLAKRIQDASYSGVNRSLEQKDLLALGYDREMAQHIVNLLAEEPVLDHYIRRGRKHGCVPVSRVSMHYPLILRQHLGLDSPGCLWAKGNLEYLSKPAVSLVGSRELNPENEAFARQVGYHAARAGLVLISGNARGADRIAQDACLEAGGQVICVVADEVMKHPGTQNILYLSEEGFDEPFSAQRALSRNRVIHALGRIVFVAQARQGKGGTWDGTTRNLRYGWSSVACFRDGSQASLELEQMGAFLVDENDLQDFGSICMKDTGFL